MSLELIRKYDVKGPRYTSYPTAPQFHDFAETDYLAALAADRDTGPISLYFHIPFCSTLCYYCACSKIVTRDRRKAVRYLDYLEREIGLVAPHFANREVAQLHWGGGTPTFLDDEQILRLMASIRRHFCLASDAEGEFGIEIDPRTVDPARIVVLRQAGFNRLSMGIQDFDEQVQRAVNRRQTFADTRAVIDAARDQGFRSVSVDLIYGLPHQTLETMARTLDRVVALSPDRISIYNYAHLPDRFTPQKRINLVDLPAADQKLQILQLCVDTLAEAGYLDIGMDHFAKPSDELALAQQEGTLHRNFQGYSTHADCDMVALGVTAISQIGNIYAQNAKELGQWEALIDAGRLAVVKGVEIDEDDRIRKAVIMALICQFTLEFVDIEREFGIRFDEYFASELAALGSMVEDNLLEIGRTGIRVLPPGRLLIRNICMVFDRYLPGQASDQRFSRAI
ncbi:MAG: oxygen-independent coproporphyrinogen III oxidase [Pseudomonadota bacterium]